MRGLYKVMVGLALTAALVGCSSLIANPPSFLVPCPATTYSSDVLWSPDGQHLAYLAQHPNLSPAIYVMRPDGSGVQSLGGYQRDTLGHSGLASFQWLADSQTLAYTDRIDIITVGLDGTTAKISLPFVIADNFQFSPDGERVAYTSLAPDRIRRIINVINPDGSHNRVLTIGYQDVLQEWSPDGTHIAYIHVDIREKAKSREFEMQEFVSTMRADGSDKRQLVEGSADVTWSPDGEWLSYFSKVDQALHAVRADGTDDKLISQYFFGWLPDGKHTILMPDMSNPGIQAVDVDTLAATTLITTQLNYTALPTWSPDGQRMAYVGSTSLPNFPYQVQDIYAASYDGSGLTQLTDNPGRYQCFHWPF